MAERIEDLLNHQERVPFGTSDLDQLAAPFAERIRSKQQRQQAQRDGHGPAKEVYPARSSSELIRELGPEYVAHVFWEHLRCDRILQRCGFSQRQCRLAEIQVVGRLLAPRSELGTVGWVGRTALDELMPGSVRSVTKDALAYHLVHTIERRLQDNGDYRSWPTIRDLLATHQMVSIVHHCTDGTVLRLRRPSQPELEQRNIYRTLRLAATPALRGRSRL